MKIPPRWNVGPIRPRLQVAILTTTLMLLASTGCGNGDEPTEVPTSPPPGQSLPKLTWNVDASQTPVR